MAKKPKTVWTVQDSHPTFGMSGKVLAIFNSELDARDFIKAVNINATAVERTVYNGQPPVQGYNK